MNIPVREFAALLPIIAENRKLQYLNISGNTLVDANADAYDLFPLEELNESYLGMAPAAAGKTNSKAAAKKTTAGPKDTGDAKVEKKKKPIKRRILEKVT